MTLSYNKFSIAGLDEHNDWDAPVNIYCTVCGSTEIISEAGLDILVDWADQHECASLAVT